MRFHHVCVAGTFGGIHAGHEALLHKAFEVGEKVLIGITTDAYVSQYKLPRLPKSLRSLMKRRKEIIGWLVDHGYDTDRYQIIPINDPFEPAASDSMLQALVVSEETKDNGDLLNEKRVGRGFSTLKLIVLPMIPGLGKLVMPEHLRDILSRPLGSIMKYMPKNYARYITVGDVTTTKFLEAGITPRLMIIDNKVNRKPYKGGDYATFQKTNLVSGPGYIAGNASAVIRRLLKKNSPQMLVVTGEEDLLVLPAVMEASAGSLVYYGQPGVGLIEVVITGQIKKKVQMLLDQFL